MEEAKSPGAVVVMVTVEDLEAGRRIAAALLEERLVACVNLLPGIESHYWWEGKLEQSAEVLLVAKTTTARLEQAQEVVRRLHSYEVFEFVALPIAAGNLEYLDWITTETRQS